MKFQGLGLLKKEIWEWPQKLNILYFFKKAGHSGLVLWLVTWSGKVYALMKFQKLGAYEKLDMGLILKS